MLRINCPECGKRISLDSKSVNKKLRHPKCRTAFICKEDKDDSPLEIFPPVATGGLGSELGLRTRNLLTPVVIGKLQDEQAKERFGKLGEEDKKKYLGLIKQAGSRPEGQTLQKALAYGRSIGEIEKFADKIRDKSPEWLRDNCRITGNSQGKGVRQQFTYSCQATTVQAVHGELDPIYALGLHEGGGDITRTYDDEDAPFSKEQKKLLESPTLIQTERMSNEDAIDYQKFLKVLEVEAKKKIETAFGECQSDYERNKIIAALQKGVMDGYAKVTKVQGELDLDNIMRQPNLSDLVKDIDFETIVSEAKERCGKPIEGPKAVLYKDENDQNRGAPRYGGDLLNDLQAVTGLTFEKKSMDKNDRPVAVSKIASKLSKGRPVPLIVGAGDGDEKHYVLAVGVDDGPPRIFFIHDPGEGRTVARTEQQVLNNQLDLPSGWSTLASYESPSKTKT